jgi:hypothetical protein
MSSRISLTRMYTPAWMGKSIVDRSGGREWIFGVFIQFAYSITIEPSLIHLQDGAHQIFCRKLLNTIRSVPPGKIPVPMADAVGWQRSQCCRPSQAGAPCSRPCLTSKARHCANAGFQENRSACQKSRCQCLHGTAPLPL